MTDKALPILFVNLAGEMFYILDNRLKAQNIKDEKAKKVLQDIISMVLNERFIEELFKPQELYNKQAMRKLFESLAHTSIMRLNYASMSKLYDLMLMVVKYQFCSVLYPRDILMVTLNHLEAFLSVDDANMKIKHLVDNYYCKFYEIYSDMSNGDLQLLRQCILNYLQDEKVKVSVLLRENLQNPDGSFIVPTSGSVPPDFEIPVIIRYNNGTEDKIDSGGNYKSAKSPGKLELLADHGTKLGFNIYTEGFSRRDLESPESKFETVILAESEIKENKKSKTYDEINLMGNLLGHMHTVKNFDVSLDILQNRQQYPNVECTVEQNSDTTIVIDARNTSKQELNEIFKEMTVTIDNTAQQSSSADELFTLLNTIDH